MYSKSIKEYLTAEKIRKDLLYNLSLSVGKLAIENNDYGMYILLQGLEEKGRMYVVEIQ